MTVLVDQHGRPLRKEVLTREVAGPTLTGIRSPIAGYPADGLNPTRLADLLRMADQGEPLEYFELAELIEERDLHYAGVLGTRKRSVAQIDITVEAASDSAEDVAKADLVREWLKRDELSDEIFDMLDAIGKGISFTEIVWDSSAGQWWPQRLEYRDPRWFTFERKDLKTPLLRGGEDGMQQPSPLPAFKFITTMIKAKSGLPIRSGIARIAAWAWMFKAFTQRDWAIFTQTYGQPVRIGKFHEGATNEDKKTLFRAVANIAGDCAAIIPESMTIDFVSADNVQAGAELYEKRADWLDRQISKAVVGQTNSTDAQSGGLGSGQADVHNDVRQDIETADCKALSAVINRDLIRPWMDLEYGPPANGRGAYPRVVIARPQREDLKQFTESVKDMVDRGLEVEQSEVRDKFGLSEPKANAKILRSVTTSTPAAPEAGMPPASDAPAAQPTLHSQQQPVAHPARQIADAMLDAAETPIGDMIEQLELMMAKANDMSELRAMIEGAYPQLDDRGLAAVIAGGISAAHAAGRSDLEAESAA